MPPSSPNDSTDPRSLRIEVAVLTVGAWTGAQQALLSRALTHLQEELTSAFPEFEWRLTTASLAATTSAEAATRGGLAMDLLEAGARHLEQQHVDFAVVVTTQSVLDDRNRPAVIVSSQLLGCGLVALGEGAGEAANSASGAVEAELAQRLLETLASLNNLSIDARSTPTAALPPETIEDWRAALVDVADERLEESAVKRSGTAFYAASAFVNLREMFTAVLRTRPWLFPFRLSKVTAGAVSTALIVLLTAESWELAYAQPSLRGTVAAVLVVLSTIVYLLRQQDLLARVHRFRLSERRVTAELATVLAVTLGMLSTFVMLYASSAVVAWLLFPPEVAANWSGGPDSVRSYLKVALLAATISVTVGALGASLEAPGYLRFVINVDRVVPDPRKR